MSSRFYDQEITVRDRAYEMLFELGRAVISFRYFTDLSSDHSARTLLLRDYLLGWLLKNLVEKPYGGDSDSGTNQTGTNVFAVFRLLCGARHFIFWVKNFYKVGLMV